MEWTVAECLAAQAIGRAAMDCMDWGSIFRAADSSALALLEEIREILNDDRLDDPECFARIDAITAAFFRCGANVSRHDFG